MPTTLSIVIVTWNVREDTRECLRSIYASDLSEEVEVFVVDNASADGTVEMVRDAFPRVKLLANTVNVGFPKANNQALGEATGEFVLYLNPDTIVMPSTLSKCLEFMSDHTDVGLLGCKVLFPDGMIQYSCARNFPSLEALVWESFYLHMLFPKNRRFGKTLMSYWDHQNSRDVPCLVGAFMLGRRDLLQQLHGMDEEIFMFFEDMDLCYRVHEAGWRVYYLADARIIHKSEQSQKKYSGSLEETYAEAIYKFFERHRGQNHAKVCRLILLGQGIIRLLVSLPLYVLTLGFPRLKLPLRGACVPELHWHLTKWALGYGDRPGLTK